MYLGRCVCLFVVSKRSEVELWICAMRCLWEMCVFPTCQEMEWVDRILIRAAAKIERHIYGFYIRPWTERETCLIIDDDRHPVHSTRSVSVSWGPHKQTHTRVVIPCIYQPLTPLHSYTAAGLHVFYLYHRVWAHGNMVSVCLCHCPAWASCMPRRYVT